MQLKPINNLKKHPYNPSPVGAIRLSKISPKINAPLPSLKKEGNTFSPKMEIIAYLFDDFRF